MLAISVENLSKRFRLGMLDREVFFEELREKIGFLARGSSRWGTDVARRQALSSRDFWALRDINFEVREGETVGIIGRNGAGKSTLLKILSQITSPTTGCARIRGRVGSLLEVGTGFHPELTGRENVYLYGSILGMKRAELDRKFDDIISFAEVEKFVDTPVKHYSSGMKIRLAFTVASFLEPEVLIIDEALSVGDFSFQEKCRQRMRSLMNDGRTLLIVSHAEGLLAQICQRCLYLDGGRLVFDGATVEAVSRYQSASGPSDAIGPPSAPS
jgi:lipopolysaccharide transport system ATP-binding protein